jgi:predicted TIM-barrel fold metal-dependent hydrolase
MSPRFPVISGDSHVNPPVTFWRDYLPAEFRDRAPVVVETEDGDLLSFEGREVRVNMLSSVAGTKPEDWVSMGNVKELLRQSRPSGWDPAARLEDLDRDGVWGEVLFGGGPLFSSDVDFCLATFDAYNRWLADFCSHSNRFAGLGYIPTWDADLAVREAKRIAELGLRGVVIPNYPVARPAEGGGYAKLAGQSDIKMAWKASNLTWNSPEFEPLWKTCIELGLPVHYHLGPTLYPRGDQPAPSFSVSSTMTKMWASGPLVEMIFGGLFQRFPELTMVSAESGAGWAAFLIEYMDRNYGRHRFHDNVAITEPPSFYFHRNFKLGFLYDLTALREREVIGVDSLMWGSDFPHSDGTFPETAAAIDAHCTNVPEEEARRIFGQNAADLYGISLPAPVG